MVHATWMIEVQTYKDVVAPPEWVLEDGLRAAAHAQEKGSFSKANRKECVQAWRAKCHDTYYRMTSLSSPGA
jgi:hypothetical protein